MRPRFGMVLVTLVALATACAKPVQCKLSPIPTSARGPAFLWRVDKQGGDVVWLYGTIHDAGLDAIPPVAIAAMTKSKRVVTELGATTPDPDGFRKYARVEKGPGIDFRLKSDDWYELRDELRSVIKENDLRRAAPWYAMSLLTTYMAPAPGPSMDVMLGKRAKELALPVEALETWEVQLSMLSTVVGIDDLTEAIRYRETMKCELASMLEEYKAGDTVSMTLRLVTPRIADTMLYARNRTWLPQIETYFGTGGAFVAVGLGHMLGEHSLPALLAKAGYTVERVTGR